MSRKIIKIEPIQVDATELYKALSYSETERLCKVIHNMIHIWVDRDENFHIVDNKITKQIWVYLPPHYISIKIDIIVDRDPCDVENLNEALSNYFHGPLSFYNNVADFELKRFLSCVNYIKYLSN